MHRTQAHTHTLVAAHDGQGPDPFAVESKVFRVTLRSKDLQPAVIDKVPHGPRIFFEIAGGVALVSRVKNHDGFALLARLCDETPLILRGVDAGGVLRASVKEDDRPVRQAAQRGQRALDGEAARRCIEVRVVGDLQAGSGENVWMDRPRRRRQMDGRAGHQ